MPIDISYDQRGKAMTDAPERIWANAQEWPKGTGRIEVYAAARPDPDEPSTEYVRADLYAKLEAKLVSLGPIAEI